MLPNLCCNGQTLFLRLDVVDCPQLKLVLPARKEVVQDEFWSDLTTEVQRILYRYVATLPHHDLSYKQWQKAKSLGIELSVAPACLKEFTPAIADLYDLEKGQPMTITERSLLIDIDNLAYSEQQVFWRAFQQAQLDYKPVAPNQDYVGYPWYDRLLRLSDVRFEIEQDGKVMGLEQWHEERFLKGDTAPAPRSLNVTVDQVWALTRVTEGELNHSEIRLPCEVLFVEDPEEYWEKLEQTPIVLSQSANLAVDDLTTLLEASYFSPSITRQLDRGSQKARDDYTV